MSEPLPLKVAVVNVGDEILYGEMSNANQRWMLEALQQRGLPARVALSLPDDAAAIARWIGLLAGSEGYDLVFVSGGIGGTHDDHTRQGIASGLGLALTRHERCFEILRRKYGDRFNEQRQRMAWLPEGCDLLDNPSGAPGFVVRGVYAFPGFPKMMQPMLLAALDRLGGGGGRELLSRDVVLPLAEGEIAGAVEQFAQDHPVARVGIYPSATKIGREVTLRLRCPPSEHELIRSFEQLVEGFRQLGERTL